LHTSGIENVRASDRSFDFLYPINLHYEITNVFETVSSASQSVAEMLRCSKQEFSGGGDDTWYWAVDLNT